MAIQLPTYPAPNVAEPLLVKFDGVLTPFMGGPVQSIGRLGTRLGLRVSMPPLEGEIARQFEVSLMMGQRERVLFEWPLLELNPGSPPNPQINAASSGMAISVKGLGAGYAFGWSQPLSVIHDGRRYMHVTTGPVTADGSGVAAVGIYPPSRVTYSVDDTVEIERPLIEGLVSPGEDHSWSYALEHTMGFVFSLIETK